MAVEIMWNELDMDVHSIVYEFCITGYPVTPDQIIDVIGKEIKQ